MGHKKIKSIGMVAISIKKRARKNYWLLFSPLIFLLGVVCIVFLSFEFAYSQRIYPKIKIANIEISNQRSESAKNIIAEQIKTKTPEEIILVGPNKVWKEKLTDFNFFYNIEESINQAYQTGRKDDLFKNWLTRKDLWFEGENLPLVFNLDRPLFEEKLNKISKTLFIPVIEPEIKIVKTNIQAEIVIEEGKDGQEVDKEELDNLIKAQLGYLETQPITIPIKKVKPQIDQKEINLVKQRAEKLLGKTLELSFEDKAFLLEGEELVNLLSFKEDFNKEKINNYTENLTGSLNCLPQNAAFSFSSQDNQKGKVTVFRPAKDGVRINQEELNQKITEALEKLERDDVKRISISIPFEKIPPEIQTEDINNLGIKELLGKGTSYFRGSVSSRIHNIKLSSARLNGILIKPGEIFSFNQSLGEVTKETGFQEAYVIKEGRTILDDGGGVCQVSTTLFRAVLYAGLPIEERHPHSYRVSYYEQGPQPSIKGQVGMDSTVFAPTADLKFKNDTSSYILIQNSFDPSANSLTFELYGTSDKREVFLSESRVWEQTPPPPDLYQDDPTLPKGTVKQIEKPIWGAKAAFDWKVTRNGEILQERTFYSVYKPWRAIFLRGAQ